MGQVVGLVIQEKQRLLRDGLCRSLRLHPELVVLAAVADDESLLAASRTHQPDAVVLDADDADRIEPLLARLRTEQPGLRAIGTYSVMNLAEARRSDAWGLDGLVPRTSGLAALVDAVLAEGTPSQLTFLDPDRPTTVAGSSLSSRELEVLGLVGRGWTSLQISARLGISPKTVDNHKQRAFVKLGVQGQAHAVAVAARSGLLDQPMTAAGGMA